MGLKKRSRVSAEFSMSSLTDIIFLLLIFFMLTSNFVRIDPFEMPESNSKTIAPTNLVVQIHKSGKMTVNGKAISNRALVSALRTELASLKDKDKASVTIVAEKGVPFEKVSRVMEAAGLLRLRAILATQSKQ